MTGKAVVKVVVYPRIILVQCMIAHEMNPLEDLNNVNRYNATWEYLFYNRFNSAINIGLMHYFTKLRRPYATARQNRDAHSGDRVEVFFSYKSRILSSLWEVAVLVFESACLGRIGWADAELKD